MKRMTIFSLAIMLSAMSLFAQTDDVKYRRSSLSMVLIESENFPDKEAVLKSWDGYPFPDKYNEHNIETKSFDIEAIKLTDEELKAAGYLKELNNPLTIAKAEALGPIRYLNDEKTSALSLPTSKKLYQLKIDKVIQEKGIAKQIIATWLNRSADGKFNMNLIQERGSYNASELEAGVAEGQIEGIALFKDAGKELIRNTFVTFTKLNFIENEPTARMVRDAAKDVVLEKLAGKPQMLIDNAMKGIDKVYDKTKEGYSLWTKTWLYQIAWSDELSEIMFSQMYNAPNKFDETDVFKLEFVGVQYNQSLVTFKIGEKRTTEQIIDLALVRNIDNAFAKLQKKNEVFMPKTPVISTNPLMAYVGTKESLRGGETFEVLEMVWNKKTSTTTWKKVGTCKVDKKAPIWDNKYNAGEDNEIQKGKDGNPVTATTFKGKNIEVGMLLKQLK